MNTHWILGTEEYKLIWADKLTCRKNTTINFFSHIVRILKNVKFFGTFDVTGVKRFLYQILTNSVFFGFISAPEVYTIFIKL